MPDVGMPIAAAISSIVVSRYPLRLNSRTDSVSSASYFDGSTPAGPLRCLSVGRPGGQVGHVGSRDGGGDFVEYDADVGGR